MFPRSNLTRVCHAMQVMPKGSHGHSRCGHIHERRDREDQDLRTVRLYSIMKAMLAHVELQDHLSRLARGVLIRPSLLVEMLHFLLGIFHVDVLSKGCLVCRRGAVGARLVPRIYMCVRRGIPWGLLERLFTAPWASLTRLDPTGVRRWEVSAAFGVSSRSSPRRGRLALPVVRTGPPACGERGVCVGGCVCRQ